MSYTPIYAYTFAQCDTLLEAKANTSSLGSMAAVNDAPSDGNIYGRQNAAWVIAGGGSGLTQPQVMARGVFGGPF